MLARSPLTVLAGFAWLTSGLCSKRGDLTADRTSSTIAGMILPVTLVVGATLAGLIEETFVTGAPGKKLPSERQPRRLVDAGSMLEGEASQPACTRATADELADQRDDAAASPKSRPLAHRKVGAARAGGGTGIAVGLTEQTSTWSSKCWRVAASRGQRPSSASG
jgi:hypothetical protein